MIWPPTRLRPLSTVTKIGHVAAQLRHIGCSDFHKSLTVGRIRGISSRDQRGLSDVAQPCWMGTQWKNVADLITNFQRPFTRRNVSS